ncbi:unnamed protein product [Blepharisma stoltei]|uniref:E3 ubiquitin-protein ligase Sina-like RING finger domain-containing protein n=1 Tax=Blepharisma stoltei TaxID=1481888 RepID=A0AAU9IT08_9CILI|nr:unnamed protein product [Blepharisma stoltei]
MEREDSLQIDKLLLSSLECPACSKLFMPPVYQCFNGHSICKTCSETKATCPECSLPLQNKFRNIALERMLESIEVVCSFKGCGKRLVLSQKRTHEQVCTFNPNIPCIFDECQWAGECLIDHITLVHQVKQFEMASSGSVRGWNSKTWRMADWGYSIWKFADDVIINKSFCSGDTFYLHLYDMGIRRRTLRLTTVNPEYQVDFFVKSEPIQYFKNKYTALPFHISIKIAEKYILESADELEEGYKRLSIRVEILGDQ